MHYVIKEQNLKLHKLCLHSLGYNPNSFEQNWGIKKGGKTALFIKIYWKDYPLFFLS